MPQVIEDPERCKCQCDHLTFYNVSTLNQTNESINSQQLLAFLIDENNKEETKAVSKC